MESKDFKELMDKITPEFLEEWRLTRIKEKESLSTNYQLGYYVGLTIVRNFLPTTSIDDLGGRKRITTTVGEYDEHKRLEESWFNGTGSFNKNMADSKEEQSRKWIALREYSDAVNEKYLPKILKCHISFLNITDEEEFKKGLGWSIFDCDFSHYSAKSDDIKIYDNDDFTVIELKLQLGEWRKIYK